MSKAKLEIRVVQAAEAALQEKQYVSPIDVLLWIGFLQTSPLKEWRLGRIPFLEKCIQANLNKISFVMKIFRAWARKKGLKSSKTAYVRQTKGDTQALRFSKNGVEVIEQAYRTHYISPELTKKKQKQLEEKMSKPPERTVFLVAKETQCSKCKTKVLRRGWLMMDCNQPLCASCAELDRLVFLPSGNANLTRRAKKYSTMTAVVVEFSRTKKRYERRGLLVEGLALDCAEKELKSGE